MSKYVLVGKAASGKDWVLRKMIEKRYVPMKQYTTRAIRDNEKGDEYHFITDELFEQMSNEGKFCSANFYAIGWYGISLNELKECDVAILSPGNVEDIFLTYPELRNEFTIVYIDMPVELRRQRLSARYTSKIGDDNERRIAADERDFKDFSIYDLRLKSVDEVNDFVNNLSVSSGWQERLKDKILIASDMIAKAGRR